MGRGPSSRRRSTTGVELRPRSQEQMALSDGDRLREEDPYTGEAVRGVPHHIIVHRSRFEFDSIDRENAVYRTPEQCWGLQVWKSNELDERIGARSLALHFGYYRLLETLLDGVAERHERFLLIDVHSYNHRRDGPAGAPAPQEEAPDINIGTFSMPRANGPSSSTR